MKLIYPMLAQILWTLFVLVRTGQSRVQALQQREVKLGAVALGNNAWPDKVKAIGNNFSNQFETPVLFYVLCGLALYTGATAWWMVGLAWLWFATRVVHSLIHMGSNNVRQRFNVFISGVAVLVAMLVGIAVHLS